MRSARVIVAGNGARCYSGDLRDDSIVATAVIGEVAVLYTLDRHRQQPEVAAQGRAHSVEVMGDVDLLRQLRAANDTP